MRAVRMCAQLKYGKLTDFALHYFIQSNTVDLKIKFIFGKNKALAIEILEQAYINPLMKWLNGGQYDSWPAIDQVSIIADKLQRLEYQKYELHKYIYPIESKQHDDIKNALYDAKSFLAKVKKYKLLFDANDTNIKIVKSVITSLLFMLSHDENEEKIQQELVSLKYALYDISFGQIFISNDEAFPFMSIMINKGIDILNYDIFNSNLKINIDSLKTLTMINKLSSTDIYLIDARNIGLVEYYESEIDNFVNVIYKDVTIDKLTFIVTSDASFKKFIILALDDDTKNEIDYEKNSFKKFDVNTFIWKDNFKIMLGQKLEDFDPKNGDHRDKKNIMLNNEYMTEKFIKRKIDEEILALLREAKISTRSIGNPTSFASDLYEELKNKSLIELQVLPLLIDKDYIKLSKDRIKAVNQSRRRLQILLRKK